MAFDNFRRHSDFNRWTPRKAFQHFT